jgi:hypothetical protein
LEYDNLKVMSTIEKPPPIGPPLDSEFWRFYQRQFGTEMEPYPVHHLGGRVALEDRMTNAENNFDQGHQLSREDIELLGLSQESMLDPLEDY